MPNYIDDWPYLSIPDFTDLWAEMGSGYKDIPCMGVRVRYTARRDFEMEIKDDGEIIVRCPADASIEAIEEFIVEEEKWIRDTLLEMINQEK